MTKNWDLFPNEQPYGEDLANFSCYRLYEKSAIAGYGVLSGCAVSRSSASAVAVASGTFTVAGVKKTFAGGSLTSISAAAAGKHRYDLVYIDGADDTLKLAAGTEDTPTSGTDFLENYVPRPAEPTDTDWICLAVVRVTESGIENTNFGTNSYATGSVANMRLGTPFGVDDSTLQVVDGVISVKKSYVEQQTDISLGAREGAYLYAYNGGAAARLGFGIRVNEIQNFIPASNHFSWNSGGDLQVSGTNELMRLTGAGKLGIGISAPEGQLDVKGDGADIDGGLMLRNASTSGKWGFVCGTDDHLWIISSNGTSITVDKASGFADGFDADKLDGVEGAGYLLHSLATAENDFLVASGSGAFVKKTLNETKTILGVFWHGMPGTPTRVSDTQFTITDTGNANSYDKIFVKGTILQWTETATFCTGMVISSSYATNSVTINLSGDSLSVGFTNMKYCIHRAQQLDFILPGTIAVGTDLGRTHYATCDLIKLTADIRIKTAGATGATTVDINDDGATIITTKPSISDTGTSDLDNVCDAPTTVIAKDSAITIDVDAVTTTAPVDLYATLFVYPEAWRYLS